MVRPLYGSLGVKGLMKFELFSIDFGKILKYQISRKSPQWEPSYSMRTDRRIEGRTGMTKVIVAFRNFANAPEKKTFGVKSDL